MVKYKYKNKEYDSILEAVDSSYIDNNINDYKNALIKHNDTEQIETIHKDDLKVFKTEDFYDFETQTIKTESDLLKEFEITKIENTNASEISSKTKIRKNR